MAISILNNPASLAAQNQLGITNSNLQKVLYQLSSGSRINSGADDAAGLAVADGLMANITALTQSARNASDGVGKLQVADGALAQVTTLLNRAITLATESANGTLSDTQRSPLQAEFASIKAEIDRIGATTNFNGQQVFQNTTVNTYVSGAVGLTAASNLGGSAPSTVGPTSVTSSTSLGGAAATWTSSWSGAISNATTLSGSVINVTVTSPGNGTNTTYILDNAGSGYATVQNLIDDVTANYAGKLTAAVSGGQLVISANGSAVGVTETNGTPNFQDGTHLGTAVAGTVANVTIGTGSNAFAYNSYGLGTVANLVTAIGADAKYAASLPATGANAGKLVITWGTLHAPNGTTGPTVSGDTGVFGNWAGSGGAKTLTVQAYGAALPTTFSDTGTLTVGTLITNLTNMGLSASLNSSGQLVVGDPSNPNNAPTIGGTATGGGNALGANGTGTSGVAANTNIYLTDGGANAANTIAIAIGALTSGSMNGATLVTNDLSTATDAQAALAAISTAISSVAALRGTLGASVNRLQSATNVINNNVQNLTAAQDGIRAADIPSTVANMAKYSILEQTGVASLAQANQMQQLVLKLLQ
jgi:flagellin